MNHRYMIVCVFPILITISMAKNKTESKTAVLAPGPALAPAVIGVLGLAGAAGIGYAIKRKGKQKEYADLIFLDDTPIGYEYVGLEPVNDPGYNTGYSNGYNPGPLDTSIHEIGGTKTKYKKWKKSLKSFFSKAFNRNNKDPNYAPNYPHTIYNPNYYGNGHGPNVYPGPYPNYGSSVPSPQPLGGPPIVPSNYPVPLSIDSGYHNTEEHSLHRNEHHDANEVVHSFHPGHSVVPAPGINHIPQELGGPENPTGQHPDFPEKEEAFPTIYRVKPPNDFQEGPVPEKTQFHPHNPEPNLGTNFNSPLIPKHVSPIDFPRSILSSQDPSIHPTIDNGSPESHHQFFLGEPNGPNIFPCSADPSNFFGKKPIDNSVVFAQEQPIHRPPLTSLGDPSSNTPDLRFQQNHQSSFADDGILPSENPSTFLTHLIPLPALFPENIGFHQSNGYLPPLAGKKPEANVLFSSDNPHPYIPPFGQIPLEGGHPHKRKADSGPSTEATTTVDSITNEPITTPLTTPRPVPTRKKRNTTLKKDEEEIFGEAIAEIENKDTYACAQRLLCHLSRLPKEKLTEEESALLKAVQSNKFAVTKLLLAVEWARMISRVTCTELYPACSTKIEDLRKAMKNTVKTL